MSLDFWRIYDQYYRRVRSFIAAFMRDDFIADDLTQETFMKVKQNLAGLQDPAKLKPWIYRVARNTCLDQLRKKTDLPLDPESPPRDAPDLQCYPEQLMLEQGEMSRCVQARINQLPEAQRTVLLLYDLLELNHEETAEVLGIKANAAKVRLHRARKALKDILERDCTFEHDERNVMVCLPKPGLTVE